MLKPVEQRALQNHRKQRNAGSVNEPVDNPEAWLQLGLEVLLEAGQRVRAMRFSPMAGSIVFKADGSPSVPLESALEQSLRQRLRRDAPGTSVVGEESGGSIDHDGVSVAIDPVDGTWALVNRSETHTTSLAMLRRGQVFLGMVANAATGEIAYALNGQTSRLLQLSCFGEEDCAFDLPLDRSPGTLPLIHLHPSRGAGLLVNGLHRAWQEGQIAMLKSPGGSPAWALLEAAKGTFVYVNHWQGRSPEPFDIEGCIYLLRQAGGEAIDLDGYPIDPARHQGPFVAGINRGSWTVSRPFVTPVCPDSPRSGSLDTAIIERCY